jgi:hypothetical protein
MGIIHSFFNWSMAGLYDVGNTCDSFVGSLWPILLQGKTTPGSSSSSSTHMKLKSFMEYVAPLKWTHWIP